MSTPDSAMQVTPVSELPLPAVADGADAGPTPRVTEQGSVADVSDRSAPAAPDVKRCVPSMWR